MVEKESIYISGVSTPPRTRIAASLPHRQNRNPRPQPHKFSKLAFLIESSE